MAEQKPSEGSGRPDRVGVRSGLLVLVLALTFLLGYCAGTADDKTDLPSINALEACNNIAEVDEQLQRDAVSLCGNTGLSDGDLASITIQACPDHAPAEITYDGQLLFFGGMMVRFHGADEFTPTAAGAPPDLGLQLAREPGRQIWVIDSGLHGEFTTSVVASMLNETNITTLVGDASLDSQLRQADLSAPIVFIDMRQQVGVDDQQLFAVESQIIDVLNTLHVSDAVAKEQMVLNLSFGAYACEQFPDQLEAAMQRLAEHGVQFTASAGNDESPERAWPAGFATRGDGLADHVISVGSITDLGGERSCFSNYGAGVEVWLPGEQIFGSRGGETGEWSGTSFATPQAAALLASGLDPIAEGFATVPSAPANLYDITIEIERNGVVDPEPIAAQTFCDPNGRFRPLGGLRSN